MNIVLSENIQNNVDKTKHAPHDSCAAGGAKKERVVCATFNVFVMSAARFIRHHVLLGLGEVRWRRQKNRNYLRLKLKNSSSFRYQLNCIGNTY